MPLRRITSKLVRASTCAASARWGGDPIHRTRPADAVLIPLEAVAYVLGALMHRGMEIASRLT